MDNCTVQKVITWMHTDGTAKKLYITTGLLVRERLIIAQLCPQNSICIMTSCTVHTHFGMRHDCHNIESRMLQSMREESVAVKYFVCTVTLFCWFVRWAQTNAVLNACMGYWQGWASTYSNLGRLAWVCTGYDRTSNTNTVTIEVPQAELQLVPISPLAYIA